jgi:hypothetical protein
MRVRISVSKPFIIDMTKIKAATPTTTPPIEKKLLTEINEPLSLDIR